MEVINLDKHQLQIIKEEVSNFEECIFLKDSSDKFFIIYPFKNFADQEEHVMFEFEFDYDEHSIHAEYFPFKEFYFRSDLDYFLNSL